VAAPAMAPEKVCPKCAEHVKAAASVCRFCGFTFPEPTMPQAGDVASLLTPDRPASQGYEAGRGLATIWSKKWVRVLTYVYGASAVIVFINTWARDPSTVSTSQGQTSAASQVAQPVLAEVPKVSSLVEPVPSTPNDGSRKATSQTKVKSFTPSRLRAMVAAGKFPKEADPTSTSKPMEFESCRQFVQMMMSQVQPAYPVRTIVDTGIVFSRKTWANDGAVMVTCSSPDKKLVTTTSPYQ
jgi:hypothetical protein